MAIQTPKTPSQYSAEILANLQLTGVTNTTPGGKARALADAIGNEMGILEANTFNAASQLLLPYATGAALDSFGAIYNVQRLQASDANAPATDGNFEFYVQTGTFGSINNGKDIVVPAGTRIFTSAANGAVYAVDVQTTLPASQSSVFFSASALVTGSAGNASAGIFNQHNFTNYTQNNFGTLLVTNNFGIVAGSDAEADEDYRYRINLKLQSAGGNAEVDIRAAVLQIPGIQDLTFNPLAGTYEVYVYGTSPAVGQTLLSLVQTALNQNTSYPIVGLALAPDLVGISLSTTLTLQSGLSTIDQTTIIASATTAAANYINNLSVGAEFVINQLADVILNSDSRILDIGNPNQPIQSIFIWRSRLDGTRYSQFLINDYTPVIGERIIVESSISNPINLTVA